jgi:hypothetical protein
VPGPTLFQYNINLDIVRPGLLGSVPSTIIFKGKRHIEGWFEEFSIPHTWRIEVSDNGWTTDILGLCWLQKCFIPAIQRRQRGGYVLLILDGYGSHLAPAFDTTCKDNNIIPIYMPPHSSHLLQPLDVGCFGPLKRAYGSLIEQKARLGFNTIDKLDFLKAHPEAHKKVFTIDNNQSGFRATGLLPFSPTTVLDRLQLRLSTPTPPFKQRQYFNPFLSTLYTSHSPSGVSKSFIS